MLLIRFCSVVVMCALSSALVWAQSPPPKPSAAKYPDPAQAQAEVASAPIISTTTSFANLQTIQQQLNFTPYYNLVPQRQVTMCILDHGFRGYQAAIGKTLPTTTYFHEPLKKDTDEILEEEHGRVMAEIVYGLMTEEGLHPKYSPILHLYKTWGAANFQHAVADCMGQHPDIILQSEVFDYGSNFDGRGIYATEVRRARQAGIAWINAAGNYAQTTYSSPVITLQNGWVQLPQEQTKLWLRCQPDPTLLSPGETPGCPARIALSWNSFSEDLSTGTDKDLDLFLYDDTGAQIAQSVHRQVLKNPGPGQDYFSREVIDIAQPKLPPGRYYIQVRNISNNFTDRDQFRVVARGDGLGYEYTQPNESLLSPADSPDVITVGASDTPYSSYSDFFQKPELVAPSVITTDVDFNFLGSSQDAAFVAAGYGEILENTPLDDITFRASGLSPEQNKMHGGPGLFLALTSSPENNVHLPATLTTSQLQFKGTGPGGCFERVVFGQDGSVADYIKPLLESGVIVSTTSGYKLLVNFNPIGFLPGQRYHHFDDMIVASETGILIMPRSSEVKLATPAASRNVEIFQAPRDAYLCNETPTHYYAAPHMKSVFRLPNLY